MAASQVLRYRSASQHKLRKRRDSPIWPPGHRRCQWKVASSSIREPWLRRLCLTSYGRTEKHNQSQPRNTKTTKEEEEKKAGDQPAPSAPPEPSPVWGRAPPARFRGRVVSQHGVSDNSWCTIADQGRIFLLHKRLYAKVDDDLRRIIYQQPSVVARSIVNNRTFRPPSSSYS